MQDVSVNTVHRIDQLLKQGRMVASRSTTILGLSRCGGRFHQLGTPVSVGQLTHQCSNLISSLSCSHATVFCSSRVSDCVASDVRWSGNFLHAKVIFKPI